MTAFPPWLLLLLSCSCQRSLSNFTLIICTC
jgi:hypothetical protein